jgi:hypothetical protein
MNDTPDTDETQADDDGFDPREAARLLDEAGREARREFSMQSPLVSMVGALIILVAYGALWLSTRAQHPYAGPSLGAIALVYTGVAVGIAVTVKMYQRATAGVSGPATRQRKVEGVAILVSYIGSPVLQGALKHYGAGPAIVYGMIPAAAPLIIVGSTMVAIAADKADWPQFSAALTAVVAGTVAAYVGPSASWLAAGIGLFVVVVGYAAVTAWQQQHAASRA